MLGQLLAIAALLLALLAGAPVVAKDKASDGQPLSQPPQLAKTDEPAPQPPTVAPRDPRVLVIIAADSERSLTELIRLRSPGGAFEAMKARGWKIGSGPENHVQFLDRDAVPDIVRQLNVREFPTVACISQGEIIRSFKDGCTTPLDAWTFGWLLTGKNERPPAWVSEPARVASTGSYRLRGSHWSVDGDWNPARTTVVSHLRSPAHGYRIASNWRIESWSYEELRSLHDDLHEAEQQSAPAARSSSSTPSVHWPKDFSNGVRRSSS
jgi:hypothetical protein